MDILGLSHLGFCWNYLTQILCQLCFKGATLQKAKECYSLFPFPFCHRRRQSPGREEVVLESWIGVESWILPKGEAEGIQPSQGPPAAPRQDLECWSTKPLESFCPFDGEVPKLNLPRQIQAVLLIPVLHEEFQHSNEELRAEIREFSREEPEGFDVHISLDFLHKAHLEYLKLPFLDVFPPTIPAFPKFPFKGAPADLFYLSKGDLQPRKT